MFNCQRPIWSFALIVLLVTVASTCSGAESEKHADFEFGKPVIGTTYFYWYDIDTRAHIVDHDGSDALTTHPADMKNISFKRSSWHRRQLLDMIDAGVDFLMPVYWGVPGQYDGWSFKGIPPLIEAHDMLLKAGKSPPAIGLFYDTSILRHNPDGHIDLSTNFGKDWFYRAMRDFFRMVPPSKWARVDGKPIVFLYSAHFAKRQDEQLMDYVRKRFAKDFGCEPFIVKHRDWLGKSDAIYQWGGAVSLQIDTHVAAIGPGYDHSAVPNRKPLIVERQAGKTYRQRWERLLAASPKSRPWMIHVETWNEWHEGTDIAHSREYGRTYIEMTRKYADLWRKQTHIPILGPFSNADAVTWQPGKSAGLTIRQSSGDGEWKNTEIDSAPCVITQPNELSPARYLYFSVADSFVYDADATLEVTITYLDKGCDSFQIEYDNTDSSKGPVQGAFRSGDIVKIDGTGKWKTAKLIVRHCRFVGRCNQADFRLTPLGRDLSLAVSRIVIQKPDAR